MSAAALSPLLTLKRDSAQSIPHRIDSDSQGEWPLVLPIVLPEATMDLLFNETLAFPGYELTIDLDKQVIVRPQGEEIPFEVQAFRKFCLLNGFDDIGLTLRQADKIKAFEAERLATKPWLAHVA